jgi:dihydrofolate reductase
MSELTVDLFTTLDGFASGEGAAAYFGFLGPDLERWVHDELKKPQLLLMGRVTYNALSTISQSRADEVSARMNALPKVVFSRTLQEPLAWANTTLVRSDLAQEIRSMKEKTDYPLRSIGSLSLVTSLLTLGLVDRLRLIVVPQILGTTGREPILAGLPDIDLELVGTDVLDSRLVALEYHPASSSRG